MNHLNPRQDRNGNENNPKVQFDRGPLTTMHHIQRGLPISTAP